MMILHKDGKGMTNMNNVCRIEICGLYLNAYMVDGSNHQIGRYDTEEEAQLMFDMIQIAARKTNC